MWCNVFKIIVIFFLKKITSLKNQSYLDYIWNQIMIGYILSHERKEEDHKIECIVNYVCMYIYIYII